MRPAVPIHHAIFLHRQKGEMIPNQPLQKAFHLIETGLSRLWPDGFQFIHNGHGARLHGRKILHRCREFPQRFLQRPGNIPKQRLIGLTIDFNMDQRLTLASPLLIEAEPLQHAIAITLCPVHIVHHGMDGDSPPYHLHHHGIHQKRRIPRQHFDNGVGTLPAMILKTGVVYPNTGGPIRKGADKIP